MKIPESYRILTLRIVALILDWLIGSIGVVILLILGLMPYEFILYTIMFTASLATIISITVYNKTLGDYVVKIEIKNDKDPSSSKINMVFRNMIENVLVCLFILFWGDFEMVTTVILYILISGTDRSPSILNKYTKTHYIKSEN